jgi:hypothetical protein
MRIARYHERGLRAWSAVSSRCGRSLGYVGLQAANGTMLEQVQALDYFAMMATLAGATNLGFPLGATGANLAYRCSTYEQTGGFEALPLGAVADDMLLIQQVLDKTNWRVVSATIHARLYPRQRNPRLNSC